MITKTELIEDVAGQLERDETPLDPQWIEARGISIEEARSVGQHIAIILRGYLALPPADRMRFVTDGILSPKTKTP